MVVHGHLVCRNEVKLVPFVMDYWKRLGVDKLFVWDNGSTDGTIEALKEYDFVEVVPFETNGGYVDEFRITQMRNTGWKLKSKGVADWVIVSDFDEVPYFYGDNFKEWLKSLDASNINRVKTKMHQLMRQDFPEYKEGLMHEYEGTGTMTKTAGSTSSLRSTARKCLNPTSN